MNQWSHVDQVIVGSDDMGAADDDLDFLNHLVSSVN